MSALASSPADKVVIITGGASGIGLSTVQLFLEAGSHVAALDVKGLDEIPPHDRLLVHPCDVSDVSQVDQALAAVLARWGRLDVLVNNAGVMDNYNSVTETSDAVWARCYAINAGGAFYLTRACVPHLSAHAHKGAIVNVASAAVNVPALAGAAYTASKHAIVGLTKSVANRERGKLTCNAVLPGPTATKISSSIIGERNPEGLALSRQNVGPERKKASAMDVARAILFLSMSPAINGVALEVDNGISCLNE